ncbi:hypothetical protein BC332_08238 [Capsicum chinense]|nr:hypothetical protein BC332_08238 [Capsicum chinense]
MSPMDEESQLFMLNVTELSKTGWETERPNLCYSATKSIWSDGLGNGGGLRSWVYLSFGMHNHDPPKICSSLVVSNNDSKDKLEKGINIITKALNLNASSSSSKHAKHSRVSPILEVEKTSPKKNKMIVADMENNGDGEEEENVNDDVPMKFEEFGGVIPYTQ